MCCLGSSPHWLAFLVCTFGFSGVITRKYGRASYPGPFSAVSNCILHLSPGPRHASAPTPCLLYARHPQIVQSFLSVTISHDALHPHFTLHPHLLRIPPFALHPLCVACVSGVHCSICAIFLVCDLLSSFHFCSFTVFPPFCSIAFVIYSALIYRLQNSFHCVL